MSKRITILGSTGSIGTQTLDVVRQFRDRFEIVGLSTLGYPEDIVEQARAFAPQVVAISDSETATAARRLIDTRRTRIVEGPDAMSQMIAEWECDLVVVATSGSAGLPPTLEAIRRGRDIALANKETLVKAGNHVMALAGASGVRILPIDSEHNAIFQCLAGQKIEAVRRILITCSGGPFLDYLPEQLDKVSIADALEHPRWNMGPKVTVDSATLMNKGFEVIEGHHLFGVDIDRIEVVIHPESICHSLVEFVDGSILAQLGPTDMRLPILNCLAWPERLENAMEPLDLCAIGQLTFRPPDLERFPSLGYAREAAKLGGTMPAVLNAANEVAVHCFLEDRIAFGDIPRVVRHVMDRHEVQGALSLEEIEEADRWARQRAEEFSLARSRR
ncbi:1-deoxy-D-xylulose 5-phosphate reductoisomerase [candidate division BRC1 bacterium SM23_51]|nr:MAG: 1-deoxy-D-xylulose 5-phosphate reductoisomerase [candidate division BRC1 bacterium SM23_51]